MPILHRHGQRSNQVPIGLSTRASFKYGRMSSKTLESIHDVLAIVVDVKTVGCCKEETLTILLSRVYGLNNFEGLKGF